MRRQIVKTRRDKQYYHLNLVLEAIVNGEWDNSDIVALYSALALAEMKVEKLTEQQYRPIS